MEYWTILLQIVPILAFGYYYFHSKYSYWSDRGVKGPKPALLLGNMWQMIRYGQVKMERAWVEKYGKVYGFYQGVSPNLTIADPELIKQVMIKDFGVFVNRDKSVEIRHDIWKINLFNSEDEQWRKIRSLTSPSFTTGKLRGMHTLMNSAVDKLSAYFNRVIQTNSGKLNMKEVVTGFTIDVIASTSFATETDANGDKNRAKNPFLENGIALFDLSLVGMLRFMSFTIMPYKFNKLVGAELGMDMKRFDFFVQLSREIIKQRRAEKTKVRRNDLVQLMMDAFMYEDENSAINYDKLTATDDNEETEEVPETKPTNGVNGSFKQQLSESEIIAQCILFFVAGFETTATTISNALYNLSLNVDVQDRLAQELSKALDGLDVESNEYFEKVNNHIPFLEATVKETLRLCPPVGRLQRRVGVDNYKLGGVPLEKDTTVDIAVYAVHHDPEYYPEPERFNPDRFMPENKHNLVPYTYLPFGAGPRNCIGMRFAYQEIRLCLAKILQQFRFSLAPETPVPLNYNKFGILSCKNIPLVVSKR